MHRSIFAYLVAFSLLLPASVVPQTRGTKGNLTPKVMNASYFDLSSGNYTQDWTNTGLITVNDIWDDVPSVVGFRGDGLTGGTGTDPQTILIEGTPVIDVNANQTNPDTFTTGGVAEFEIANPSAALTGSGTADAPSLVFYMNTTGRQSVNIAYNVRDLDASTDNAIQQIALQYRVGNTGDFANVPAGYIADATEVSAATLVTPISVTLPAAVENQAQVEIRVITSNAVGNDEWVGIDDVVISSSPAGGGNAGTIQFSSPTYTQSEDGVSATITATRTGGTTGAVGVTYGTQNGTATGDASCGTAGADYNPAAGTLSWIDGDPADKTFSVTICDDAVFEGNETVDLSLSTPTGGATLGAQSTAVLTIIENDPQPAVVEFSSPQFVDDESQSAVVTVTRSGNTAGASSVEYTMGASTAISSSICGLAADFVESSGTVSFANGEVSKQIVVPMCADAFTEPVEEFNVFLSNPSGAVLGSTTVTAVSIVDTASKYRNVNTITIEDGALGTPYPSDITVSGEAGPVGSIRVTLYDMQHINAADVDVLLVGPGGQQILLMADAGGPMASPQTLTFVDSAGQVVPQSGSVTTGNYEPTTWTSGQPDFSAPAPAGPYNEPGSAVGGGPNLTSVFGGTDPNGTWRLYVRDDNGAAIAAGGTNGTIAGWGLEIFSQTGAATSISGRVRLPEGAGVRGAIVLVSGGGLLSPKFALTNTAGYYNISGLQAGQTYTIQVSNRRYIFSPSIAAFTSNGNLSGADILAFRAGG